MELKWALLCSEGPATGPYPQLESLQDYQLKFYMPFLSPISSC